MAAPIEKKNKKTPIAQEDISFVDTIIDSTVQTKWQEKIKKGIDFIAKGNEPFWSVEIDFQKAMQFKSLNGDSLFTPVPAPAYAQDAQVVRYAAETRAGILQVTLAKQTCIDDMSGEAYPYRVSVDFKSAGMAGYNSYKGCGRYIGSYQLNNTWVLEAIDGAQVDTSIFTDNKPFLHFQLAENSMYGFGGCNRIQGNIQLSANAIQFKEVTAAKIACPALSFEQELIDKLIQQSFAFHVEGQRLILKNKQTTLTFKSLN